MNSKFNKALTSTNTTVLPVLPLRTFTDSPTSAILILFWLLLKGFDEQVTGIKVWPLLVCAPPFFLFFPLPPSLFPLSRFFFFPLRYWGFYLCFWGGTFQSVYWGLKRTALFAKCAIKLISTAAGSRFKRLHACLIFLTLCLFMMDFFIGSKVVCPSPKQN